MGRSASAGDDFCAELMRDLDRCHADATRSRMHEDALARGKRVLLVDDLIATGGTADAAVKLIRRLGGHILGAAFVIDLPELGGAALLKKDGIEVHALMAFEGH